MPFGGLLTIKYQNALRSLISWLVKELVALTVLGPNRVVLMLAPMVTVDVPFPAIEIAVKALIESMPTTTEVSDSTLTFTVCTAPKLPMPEPSPLVKPVVIVAVPDVNVGPTRTAAGVAKGVILAPTMPSTLKD